MAIRDFMATVAMRWVQPDQVPTCGDIPMQPPRLGRVHPKSWTGTLPLTLHGKKFGKLFGRPFAIKILTWLNELLCDGLDLQWISFYQLFLHYQLSFKDAGVVLQNGKWYVVRDSQPCFAEQFGFKFLAKSFRLMIQQCLRDCHIKAATATVRPESQWICCHVGAIALPVRVTSFTHVEAWLSKKLGVPATGQGKTLNSLPVET